MAVELPVVRMALQGREPRPLASSAGGGRHRRATYRCAVRWPEASACRPEVGVPSRPRASSRLGLLPLAPRSGARPRNAVLRGWRAGKGPPPGELAPTSGQFSRWGTCREGNYTATYRCAVRWPEASACRPEVGVPSRPRASSRLGYPLSRRTAGRNRAMPRCVEDAQARGPHRENWRRPLASSAGGGRHRRAPRGEIAQCSSVLMTCRRGQPHE